MYSRASGFCTRLPLQVALGRAAAIDGAAVLDLKGRVVVAATSQEVAAEGGLRTFSSIFRGIEDRCNAATDLCIQRCARLEICKLRMLIMYSIYRTL